MVQRNREERILGKNVTRPPLTSGQRRGFKTSAKASDKDVVLAAAEKLAGAIRRGNKTTADKLLAREFTFIDAAGKLHSRREVLAQMKVAPDSSAARIKVRTYGRVAVVTGASKSAQARRRND